MQCIVTKSLHNPSFTQTLIYWVYWSDRFEKSNERLIILPLDMSVCKKQPLLLILSRLSNNLITFFALKVIGKFFDVQKCVFHSFFREKKDLSLEWIRWLAHCRITLFPRPSGLHYELENGATVEKSTLQKQVGCFNPQSGYYGCRQAEETVVMRGSLLGLKTNCIRQPKRQLSSSSYNHNKLTTLRTSVKESLQNALQSCSKELVTKPGKHRCYEGCQYKYCGCKMI